MGRMVTAYVVSAFRDLMDEINRRFEANRFMLRVRSLLTGRSVAELALRRGPAAKGRGDLSHPPRLGRARRPLAGQSGGDAAAQRPPRSGILTAINEVATEAFAADEAALRRIDLGSVRSSTCAPRRPTSSPSSAAAPRRRVEQTIDEQFVATIERLRPLRNGDDGAARTAAVNACSPILPPSSSRHRRAAGEVRGAPARLSPAAVLLWGLVLLLAAWAAWSAYAGYRDRTRAHIADACIAGEPGLRGYPVHVGVEAIVDGARSALLGPRADAGRLDATVAACVRRFPLRRSPIARGAPRRAR